ncbi:MAG: type II toxin-antitoxin system VapC family toxin [Candidatus Omnitrophota bacterium]
MPRVYLDSCIVIYLVERAQEAESFVFQPDVRIYVSDLTRLECRVFPIRHQNLRLLERYDAFFDLPEVALLALNTEIFALAAQLRAEHRIKTPDAIHLAAAIQYGCEEFWTNDNRLAVSANGRIKVVVPFA